VLDDVERFRRVHDVIPVLAEHDGAITGIGAREGAYVRPGEIVVSYADRHAAWAEIILTPDVLTQIRGGDEVELHSTLSRGASAIARLDPALAVIDPTSSTARVRVPLAANTSQFLPGTLLEGRIRMKARRALTIPVDTVLRTGGGDFVILAEPENHFRQMQVRLGAESGDRVEVLEGLIAGQTVVTNGQFMLSAESSLQSSWRRFAATERSASPPSEGDDIHHHASAPDVELSMAEPPGTGQRYRAH
jgi:Cu(I)/Ag(I) efflux system membrane fusion protein